MIDPYVVGERSDEAWSHLFFIEFLKSMGDGLGPGRTADFREKFVAFMNKAQAGYRERKIGPRSLAPIVLLMQFGLMLTDFDIDSNAKRHVLIVLCQAVMDEVKKRENDITDRACLAALNGVLYRPLMPVWKMLIELCYSAYKVPLEQIICGSTSLEAWEDEIRDIWPLLYVSKLVPTHEVQYADRVTIPDPEFYGEIPATYTNGIRTPLPLYTRIFGPADIKAHLDEQKMMEEIFAHLSSTLGMIALRGDRYFRDRRAEVLATAKEKGRMAAHQHVLRLHTHNLALPKFYADQLLNELRSLSARGQTE